MRGFSLNLHNMSVVVMALDLLFVVSILTFAYYLFGDVLFLNAETALQGMQFVALLGAACFSMGLYNDCYELPANLLTKVLIVFLITFAVMLCLSVLPIFSGVQARAVFIFTLIGCAGVLVTRCVAAAAAKRERFCRRVLVVGEAVDAERLHQLHRAAHTTRFSFIGSGIETAEARRRDAARLTHIRRSAQVHELVLPDDRRLDPDMTAAILQARLEGVRITVLSAFLEKETHKIELSCEESHRLILTCSARRTWFSRALKRLIDVVGSVVLLLFTLPLIVLVAILIKLDDGGPIFYRQKRVGLGNRPFMLTKLRTMRVDAEAGSPSRWASVGDDRITRVGRYLRRPRIDEIPQLFDILCGHMSLVGPRPEQLTICERLNTTIPLYGYRHLVPPGLTGWAQINFPYAASIEEAEEKTRYDLYYLKNGSVILDLMILMHTVRIVLFGQGAR